jgi:hypothetical protein
MREACSGEVAPRKWLYCGIGYPETHKIHESIARDQLGKRHAAARLRQRGVTNVQWRFLQILARQNYIHTDLTVRGRRRIS